MTGVIGGTPDTTGVITINVTATNAGGTTSYPVTLTLASSAPILTATITLSMLQALAPGAGFPIRYIDLFTIPDGFLVSDYFVQTVQLPAIATNPSADSVFSSGTNPAPVLGDPEYANIIVQRASAVALGGNTKADFPIPDAGPYSPSLVKFRIGLNGSIFAEFPQLTAGAFFISLTLEGVAPVITSPLTASGVVGNAFTYTTTATGSVPITYGATNPSRGPQYRHRDRHHQRNVDGPSHHQHRAVGDECLRRRPSDPGAGGGRGSRQQHRRLRPGWRHVRRDAVGGAGLHRGRVHQRHRPQRHLRPQRRGVLGH